MVRPYGQSRSGNSSFERESFAHVMVPRELEFLEQLRNRGQDRLHAPRSAGAILAAMGRRKTARRASRLDRFREAWRQAVGELAASASHVSSYKDGVLRVSVESQALAHELGVFRANDIVARMNALLEGKDRVATLRLRTGKR